MNLLRHEELLVHQGERSGAHLVIAIHSTALGPSLGGARLWRYQALGDAIADALRLSQAMTYKAAAAGLELGGGKAVLCAPPDQELTPEGRRDLMLDLGDAVESLDGRYVTAEDVGTGTADMAIVGERTSHVVGRPAGDGGSGDPSPVTARGVEAAIRACCEHRYGSGDLDAKVVTIAGIGHVGLALAERLAEAGCELRVADIDDGKRDAAERLGAAWVDPESAAGTECDVFAPCALGGAINPDSLGQLRCEIVCGSANNVLADDSLAAALDERGILYAPDFIANAGGLINVYGELRHLGRDQVEELVDGIGDALGRVFQVASARSVTPLEAAKAVADEALDEAQVVASDPTVTGLRLPA
jgi:leucine dehydrogenase